MLAGYAGAGRNRPAQHPQRHGVSVYEEQIRIA